MNEVVEVEQPEQFAEDCLTERLPNFLREKISFLHGEYLDMSQEDLEHEIFGSQKPDLMMSRLKLNFWNEYDEVCKKPYQQMRLSHITGGVCTLSQFRKLTNDKHRLAWLIQVPADYRLSLADIHELSLAQMREIMVMDNYDDKGNVNVKLLDVKFKVAQHVDMRLKGAIVQRIDQRNLNLNMNSDVKPETAKDVALSMDEIENRLAELKQKSRSLTVPGGIKVDLLSEITRDDDIIEVNVGQQETNGS